MSRLDSFIRRLEAQRDCLDWVVPRLRGVPGPVLEVGLGNGRTYDHLRVALPERDIYVFERKVAAHPDCIPPPDRLFLGEGRDTLAEAAKRLGRSAALVHCDLGTGDRAANAAMAEWLAPGLDALLASGGYALVNQPLAVARWERLPEPPGVPAERYFVYRARD